MFFAPLFLFVFICVCSCGNDLKQPIQTEDIPDFRWLKLTGPTRFCENHLSGYEVCYDEPAFGFDYFAGVHGVPGQVTWFIQGGHIWGTSTGNFPLHVEYYDPKAILDGVYAVTARDAWAVGKKDGRGLVLRWNGEKWKEQELCISQKLGEISCEISLEGVEFKTVFSVGNSVWIGGNMSGHGVIYQVEYGILTEVSPGGSSFHLESMWGADKNSIVAVGWRYHPQDSAKKEGVIYYWDGLEWSVTILDTFGISDQRLYAVWGTDPNDIWFVGGEYVYYADGFYQMRLVALHWDGIETKAWELPGVVVYSIWGTDKNNVWFVGRASSFYTKYRGTVLMRWDGREMEIFDVTTKEQITSLWGSNANDIWAVGSRGAILHWDGFRWEDQVSNTPMPPLPSKTLVIVDGDNAPRIPNTDMGGNRNVIMERKTGLRSVWGLDMFNIWAVGSFGSILKWDGLTWNQQELKDTFGIELTSIWGANRNNIWAVGEQGTILYWNGSSWNKQNSGIKEKLDFVWGINMGNVWAVGEGGTILHWNGSSWNKQNSGTIKSLYSVWGADENNIWAVGQDGVILFWDGMTWTQKETGGGTYRSIWGTNKNNIWVVGKYGIILFWDGTKWINQRLSMSENWDFDTVWGIDEKNVWAAGSSGSIVKWNGSSWNRILYVPTQIYSMWGNGRDSIWAVGATESGRRTIMEIR